MPKSDKIVSEIESRLTKVYCIVAWTLKIWGILGLNFL